MTMILWTDWVLCVLLSFAVLAQMKSGQAILKRQIVEQLARIVLS